MAEKKKRTKEDTGETRVIDAVRSRAHDAYDLGKTKARDTYDLGRNKTKEAYDYGKEKVIHAKIRTEDKIKEHPLKSILIAAGIGALVGAVVALVLSSKTQR